jgi:hypothetical protein
MAHLDQTAHELGVEQLVAHVLAAPSVRPDEVARARVLLASRAWSRPREVADELVSCLVLQRVP